MTNKLLKALPLATSLLLLSGCIIHVSSVNADVKKQQQLALSSAELKALIIDADAGSLQIKGNENADEISVTATIYTNEEQNNYTLTLKQQADKAVLIAKHYNKTLGIQIYNGDSPTIDLVVTVPSHFNLDIDDDSGDINIDSMQGNITLDDDSGSIDINSANNVTIDDDSGDISLQNIRGNVQIDDDSGSITINKVTGNLSIEDDSGDIEVDNVNGLVTIKDGSGDIRVNNTRGLTIIDAGSGDLSIDNINGPVKLD